MKVNTAIENKKEFAQLQVDLWQQALDLGEKDISTASQQIAAWKEIIRSCVTHIEMENKK